MGIKDTPDVSKKKKNKKNEKNEIKKRKKGSSNAVSGNAASHEDSSIGKNISVKIRAWKSSASVKFNSWKSSASVKMKSCKTSVSAKINSLKTSEAGVLTLRKAAAAVLLILLAVFIFNVFRINQNADTGGADIEDNIRMVEKVQTASVETTEKAIDKLGEAAISNRSIEDRRAFYKKKFSNAIVVGDSLTEGLSVYDWLSEEHVFSEIGASVVSGKGVFKKAAATYPKVVFFAYGMNDMGNYAGDADAFIRQYSKLLKMFRKKTPKTKIYVCSISTPTDGAIKENKPVGHYRAFNKAIKAMCKKERLQYIDTSYILPEHPEFYAEDGIHASTEYYPIWMNLMIKKARL